jgi:5-(hydroxymethyl)furfural/furfural oxidase
MSPQSANFTPRPTHLVIGGGSAGCVMAARLSENPAHRVLLLEAGHAHPLDAIPPDISDTYAGRALANPAHFWPDLRVRRSDAPELSEDARAPFFFEQARVLGGGSSINGQVALRGAPDDFEHWHASGATGWDWAGVLPYFRRLERDLDITDQFHGATGPIAIRRIPRERWDDFTLAVTRAWEDAGHAFLPDLNGDFAEGYGPIPLSNDGEGRSSTATGHLDAAARARPNLTILDETVAQRILFEGRRAIGVEATRAGETLRIEADTIVLSAGALRSPWLLMLSGIGPADHLARHGIPVVADRAGVGANLQDHPQASVSAYLPAHVRGAPVIRRNYVYGRWSSGLGEPADMVSLAVCRSAWHAVGERIATLSSYVALPCSRGRVRLASPDPRDAPDVVFNWLDDPRDLARSALGFRRDARTFLQGPVAAVSDAPFASRFSARIRAMGRPTPSARAFTSLAALALDAAGPLRGALVDHVVAEAPPLRVLLSDESALANYLRSTITSPWHVCGTCRMGRAEDPLAVTDARGRVIGVEGLTIADASLMPRITRTNTNLPTIMIAERIADLMAR